MLIVGLLQDDVEVVREKMATSVGTILSSLSLELSVGMRIFHVCIVYSGVRVVSIHGS